MLIDARGRVFRLERFAMQMLPSSGMGALFIVIHAPPAFRFLSPEDKETDTFSPELYKRYQKLFTDEPQCFFEDSPADCFLSSNQKGEKKTLLDELMKDGEDLGNEPDGDIWIAKMSGSGRLRLVMLNRNDTKICVA